MKKILILSLILFSCIPFTACGNKDVKYQLDSIDVSINHIDYTTYDIETFENKYPGKADELGKLIIIRNNNKLIFNGELTKEINGKAEFLDVGPLIYITFKEQTFYDIYLTAEINKLSQNELHIWTGTELINGRPTEFIYKFKRAD